jgi:arabinofuranosyltransferase
MIPARPEPPSPASSIGPGLLAALVTFALWWPIRGFMPDDAYIHMQYAKHLRDGDGLVFNLGERVYGTTSPLWSALLAALGRLGLDLRTAAVGASLAAALGASFLGAHVLARFVPAGPAALLAAVAFASDAWFVRWSGSGMETSLGTFLVLAGFDRYGATRPWGARTLAPACWWAAAALVRPEAALLCGLLAVRAALDPGPPAARLRRATLALAPAALVGTAWTLVATAYYGTPLPITLAAKSAEYAGLGGAFRIARLMATEFAASRPIESAAVAIAAILLLARRLAPVDLRAHVVPAGWLLGLPLFYMASGVPGVTRYIVPITPLLVAYGWGVIARLWPDRRVWAGAALAGAAVTAYTFGGHVVPQARAFQEGLAATFVAQGKWFAANTPPGTRIAIRDIGAFAYHADRPVVDLAGLVTPESVPLMHRHTYDDIALELRFAEHARPEYFVDAATSPSRMIADSRYGGCLTLVHEARLDHRALLKNEPAWVSAYRVDWACVEGLRGAAPTSR